MRPEVEDAVAQAGLVVDVEEGEHDRRVMARERVLEPALPELAATDRAEPARRSRGPRRASPLRYPSVVVGRVPVAGLGGGQALEGVVDDQLAPDDLADQREVRGGAAAEAAAFDHIAVDVGRDLEQLHRHRQVGLVGVSRCGPASCCGTCAAPGRSGAARSSHRRRGSTWPMNRKSTVEGSDSARWTSDGPDEGGWRIQARARSRRRRSRARATSRECRSLWRASEARRRSDCLRRPQRPRRGAKM